MGFLNDFITARAIDNSPAYARKKLAEQQYQMQQQQAQQQAQWLQQNRESFLGQQAQPAQLGLPSGNPELQGVPAQQGTGAYAPNVDPMQRHIMEGNYKMLASGLPQISGMGADLMKDTRGNIMTGINQLNLERWKKNNLPQKAETIYASPRVDASGRLWAINKFTNQNELVPGGGSFPVNEGGVNVDIFNNTEDNFKNERDLRKDFEALPTTKAFKEVQHAYDQVRTALSRPSAANDLAAATKFMKILDPGSVVRESELMMAMEASGKLDYFLNTANRIMTGEKLTETQRVDFLQATEALYKAAAQRYNAEAEYNRSIASQYNLDPNRVAVGIDMDKLGGSNDNSGYSEADKVLQELGL